MKMTKTILFSILTFSLLQPCQGKTVSIAKEGVTIESFYVSDNNIHKFDSIRISIILPPNYHQKSKKYPVLYFLPGYNQTDSVIYDLKIAALLNQFYKSNTLDHFIFVTFDNQNNNYTNWAGKGQLWSNFINQSLIEIIDSKYRTLNTSQNRGLYGVSMGGQGALYNGLRNPDKFGVIMSHSASLHFPQLTEVFDWAKPHLDSYFSPIYGKPLTQEKWQQNNVIWYVENNEIASRQKIYFDVGVKDHLQFHKTNILLDQAFNRKLIPHTFRLSQGGHGNKYYQQNMPVALKFWGHIIKENVVFAKKK